ncbi:MAG TPA: hypothetical protein VGZ93_01170 [Candidatus Methylacidiphilales bacterium]|nr:hypothetical protein [Candidatus Methylacidiphilales bacterium]
MKTRSYLIMTTVIFAFVALMHLMRLVLGWSVILGTTSIPFWVSLLAVFVSAGVAIWGLTLVRRT